MGSRRRQTSEDLPLFDLPLRPGEEAASDVEADAAAADDLVGGDDEAGAAGARANTVVPSDSVTADRARAERSVPGDTAQAASTARRQGAPACRPAARQPQPLESASLFGPEDLAPESDVDDAAVVVDDDWLPVEATLQDRLLGGLLDLALNLIVFGLVVLIVRLPLDVAVGWTDWPAFAVFGLIFTFLYWTVPLAFWGQTPGMAWAGHAARSVTDEPLTFGQTVLRWIGGLLTVGFAGLPLLLVLVGSRSLSDRLSDSKTLEV